MAIELTSIETDVQAMTAGPVILVPLQMLNVSYVDMPASLPAYAVIEVEKNRCSFFFGSCRLTTPTKSKNAFIIAGRGLMYASRSGSPGQLEDVGVRERILRVRKSVNRDIRIQFRGFDKEPRYAGSSVPEANATETNGNRPFQKFVASLVVELYLDWNISDDPQIRDSSPWRSL